MTLPVGSRIAHFEVTGLLGVGGMGQVYRATDTKLRRQVALKILPDAFASDRERLARFEREAQALAALNHSGIAAIYGIEEFDGTLALVLELISGPTLEERIGQGPVPIAEAVRLAIAIAAAVEAAHEQGIIHRDLKPANIKISSDGAVKVLDFGLAKALSLDGGTGATVTSEAPTQPAPTTPGVILGTAAYMSPEQARGEPVDERTDVWAFGCILYEMLVGRPPFGRGRLTDVLAGVLKDEPDWSALPDSTPPLTRRLLRRCLEKDRRERLRHIADARADLRDSLEPDDARQRPPIRRKTRGAAALVTATVIAIAAVAGVAVWLAGRRDLTNTARPELVSFEITDMPPNGQVLAISPDARNFVYANGQEIVLHSLRQASRRQAQWEGRTPFFWADGASVGFFRAGESSTRDSSVPFESGRDAGELWRVPIGGGSPTLIADLDLEHIGGGSCCADDRIVVVTPQGLYRVPTTGGAPELLLARDPAEDLLFTEPEILPGGQTVLFTVGSAVSRWPGDRRGQTRPRIDSLDLESLERRIVLPSGDKPRYSRTGHLVYLNGGRLQAVAFDPDTLKTRGDPRELVDENVTGLFDVADDGTIVYQPVPTSSENGVWVDRNGRHAPYSAPAAFCGYPRISPDGKKVVADCFTPSRDIWIWDLEREVATRLTDDPAPDLLPHWSKDGSRVYFSSNRSGGALNVYSRAADGTGADELLLESDAVQYVHALTPDGAQLLVAQDGPNGLDIVAIDLEPPHEARTLLATTGDEKAGSFSPDGRWVVYDSDVEGQREVYVGPFPDLESRRWKISSGGGDTPVWSPKGDEIFFRGPTGSMMAAQVTFTPTFVPGKVTELFPNPREDYELGYGGRKYDVFDGRFLLWKKTGDAPVNRVVVLLDALQSSGRRR